MQRQVWTTEDGLPQNSIHAILQTFDGYLWLATEDGIARFDGVRFSTFSTQSESAIPSNDVCCLAQTPDGSLWIGTSDGVVRYRANRFERVQAVTEAVVSMLPAQDGTLLVLTAARLLRVGSLDVTPVLVPDGTEPTALGPGADGQPLIVAGSTVWRAGNGQPSLMRRLPVQPLEMFGETADRLWLRTRSEVILSSSFGDRHWLLGKDLPGTRLESITRTADGVFAGTNQGVYALHDAAPVSPVPEVAGSAVLCAFTDREGDRWFGTDSSGLIVLRQRAIGTVPALQSETITSVAEASDDSLWIGTRDSGIRRLQGQRVLQPSLSPPLASDVVLSLAPGTHGDIWVGTPEGLDHVRGRIVQHLSSADGLPDDFVRSLLAEADSTVWIGTRRGMAHLVNGHVAQVYTAADGLPSEVIGTMLRDISGDLWVGTLRGLVRLRQGRLQRFGQAEGIRGNVITALAQTPDGMLWVGTKDGGLSAGRGEHFASFQAPQLQGQIDALLPDGRGGLWLRNPFGVARVSITDLEACNHSSVCRTEFRQYGTADGMISVDSSSDGHPSAWRSRSGLLWFATRRGLAVIDAKQYTRDLVPPPVVLEQFLVDDRLIPLSSGPIRIGPGHRRFNFTFAGLSFAAPSQVLYRFQLQGFDRDWVEAGNRRVAEYTNLPSGTYRMLVEARNADGVRSTHPAELSFVIDPPLYRRWWFFALLLLLAAAIVYGIYRLRLRRVQHEFSAVLNERNRIAREIHDTLAQDFVAVSLQLEVTSQLLKQSKTDAAREQIDLARQLVRDGIREARESIWALRANTSVESLPAQLKTIAERTEANGTTARFAVTGAYRALPAHVEKELLRIAKEAVGNAARHAGAAQILIDLVYLEDAVKLEVSDDGAGFDLEQGSARAGHYGLRGMRERAMAISGDLELKSAPGKGTSVTLLLRS